MTNTDSGAPTNQQMLTRINDDLQVIVSRFARTDVPLGPEEPDLLRMSLSRTMQRYNELAARMRSEEQPQHEGVYEVLDNDGYPFIKFKSGDTVCSAKGLTEGIRKIRANMVLHALNKDAKQQRIVDSARNVAEIYKTESQTFKLPSTLKHGMSDLIAAIEGD